MTREVRMAREGNDAREGEGAREGRIAAAAPTERRLVPMGHSSFRAGSPNKYKGP